MYPAPRENEDGSYTLMSAEGTRHVLRHVNYYGDETAAVNEDADLLLWETFDEWEKWFDKGNLPDISDRRDADAVESLLLSVKMQQMCSGTG